MISRLPPEIAELLDRQSEDLYGAIQPYRNQPDVIRHVSQRLEDQRAGYAGMARKERVARVA